MSKRLLRLVAAMSAVAWFAAPAVAHPAGARPVQAAAQAQTPRSITVLAQSGAAPPPQAQDSKGAPNPRIALVIGESTYADATLATPANDAALVAQTLQAAGFEVVGARDLDDKALRGALKDFVAKAASVGPGLQAFIYFSGRAVQYEGENFLVPVDAQIAHASDTPIETVRVSDFAHALAAALGEARILVIDGARSNPYASGDAPLAPGLALVDPDAGLLVAFNAAPDAVAPDEGGDYGVYAKTLAGAMREGGLPLDAALAQTRVLVNEATKGAQIPWFASKLAEPYFVFERAADAPPPAAATAIAEAERKPIRSFPADEAYAAAVQRDTLPAYQDYLAAYPDAAQARRVRAILAARREALFWRRSIAADTPRGYWTYLRAYPRGPHAADARRRLAVLSARDVPPPDFAPVVYEDLPPPPPDEIAYIERPYWVVGVDFGPPPPPPPRVFAPLFEPAWINLPPPARPSAWGVLPTLTVTLPLLVTARAYQDAGRRRGFAPPNAPRVALPAPAPPRLPPNIKIKPPTPRDKPPKQPGADLKPLAGSGPAQDGKGPAGSTQATDKAKSGAVGNTSEGSATPPDSTLPLKEKDKAKRPSDAKLPTKGDVKPSPRPAPGADRPAAKLKLPEADGVKPGTDKGSGPGPAVIRAEPKAKAEDKRISRPADKPPTKLAKPPTVTKPSLEAKPPTGAKPKTANPGRLCGKPDQPSCP